MGAHTDAPVPPRFLPSVHHPENDSGHAEGVFAMTQTVTPTATSQPIKLKHKAMWAFGDYDRVATDVIPELGHVIVDAAGIEAGTRVLDVAAGSGNASVVAAAHGASVVASDLTPELLATGRA